MSDTSYDPYEMPADAVSEPPKTLRSSLTYMGPGLILAASIVGTGELINTTSLGAKAGFTLLWLILLSCVIKVFVQVELGRYAITHGKTSLAAFNTLPGPRFGASWICWLWLLMMLATQAQIAAMEGTVGQAAHMAFPAASDAMARAIGQLNAGWGAFLADREEYIWAALTTLAAIALLLSGGYKRLERVTTILVAAVNYQRQISEVFQVLGAGALDVVNVPASGNAEDALELLRKIDAVRKRIASSAHGRDSIIKDLTGKEKNLPPLIVIGTQQVSR